MSFEQLSNKLFGVHGVPEVLYVRGTFTHSRVAQKGTRGMKRHGEPDIPRLCVKGWNGTFPFPPTASSSYSFVFRVLTLCDMPKNCTHCHVRTNQSCFGEKKIYGNKRNKKFCLVVRWCSFLIYYRIMIISILTLFAHAQYCFIIRNAPRAQCTI